MKYTLILLLLTSCTAQHYIQPARAEADSMAKYRQDTVVDMKKWDKYYYWGLKYCDKIIKQR